MAAQLAFDLESAWRPLAANSELLKDASLCNGCVHTPATYQLVDGAEELLGQFGVVLGQDGPCKVVDLLADRRQLAGSVQQLRALLFSPLLQKVEDAQLDRPPNVALKVLVRRVPWTGHRVPVHTTRDKATQETTPQVGVGGTGQEGAVRIALRRPVSCHVHQDATCPQSWQTARQRW